MGELVAGLDGFKGKWVAVVLEDGRFREALLFDTLAEGCARLAEARAIGIDIPIGLPQKTAGRAAEKAARAMLGAARVPSVFPTYPCEVYACATLAEASRMAVSITGKRIGSTAFALKAKIQEAAAITDACLFEVHPEVSFAAMLRGPLLYAKRTWNGLGERRQLLMEQGILIPCVLNETRAGSAAPDDMLDAAAAAWTAWRKLKGDAKHLPAHEVGDEGMIWY